MSSARFIRRRGVLAAAILVALIGAGAGAFALRATTAHTKPPAAAQPQALPVPVAVIEEREVTIWDEFSGRLEAVERVDVRSRVAGAVKSVHFTEGALVKRDDLLVTIDPDPYAAEVERAQAQVVAAQARVNYTKSERERAQRLWDESAIARRELDERVNAAQEAEASLRGAQAALTSRPALNDNDGGRIPGKRAVRLGCIRGHGVGGNGNPVDCRKRPGGEEHGT
jgi:membrane fusion protein, multidrug efflux system